MLDDFVEMESDLLQHSPAFVQSNLHLDNLRVCFLSDFALLGYFLFCFVMYDEEFVRFE